MKGTLPYLAIMTLALVGASAFGQDDTYDKLPKPSTRVEPVPRSSASTTAIGAPTKTPSQLTPRPTPGTYGASAPVPAVRNNPVPFRGSPVAPPVLPRAAAGRSPSSFTQPGQGASQNASHLAPTAGLGRVPPLQTVVRQSSASSGLAVGGSANLSRMNATATPHDVSSTTPSPAKQPTLKDPHHDHFVAPSLPPAPSHAASLKTGPPPGRIEVSSTTPTLVTHGRATDGSPAIHSNPGRLSSEPGHDDSHARSSLPRLTTSQSPTTRSASSSTSPQSVSTSTLSISRQGHRSGTNSIDFGVHNPAPASSGGVHSSPSQSTAISSPAQPTSNHANARTSNGSANSPAARGLAGLTTLVTSGNLEPGKSGSSPGGRYVAYQNEVRVGGTRAWRNNNPGNIEYGKFAKDHGAIGTDGRFAIFPNEKAGTAALSSKLKSATYSSLTIRDAIHKYAPPFENDTKAYIRGIEKSTGLKSDQKLNQLSDNQLGKLIQAIRGIEGGKAGTSIQRVPSAAGSPISPDRYSINIRSAPAHGFSPSNGFTPRAASDSPRIGGGAGANYSLSFSSSSAKGLPPSQSSNATTRYAPHAWSGSGTSNFPSRFTTGDAGRSLPSSFFSTRGSSEPSRGSMSSFASPNRFTSPRPYVPPPPPPPPPPVFMGGGGPR